MYMDIDKVIRCGTVGIVFQRIINFSMLHGLVGRQAITLYRHRYASALHRYPGDYVFKIYYIGTKSIRGAAGDNVIVQLSTYTTSSYY